MNLKENIFRIQSLISENDLGNNIRKLIDKFGFLQMYKTMGEIILGYVTKDDKLNFIKEKVIELSEEFGGGGISTDELFKEPIFYGETNEELHQIEYLNDRGVYVDVYDLSTDSHVGDFFNDYENLPDDILNEVFKFLLHE